MTDELRKAREASDATIWRTKRQRECVEHERRLADAEIERLMVALRGCRKDERQDEGLLALGKRLIFLESQNSDAAKSREVLVAQLAEAQRENARMRESISYLRSKYSVT